MAAKTIRANTFVLGLLICMLLGYTASGPASASPIPGPEFSIASVSTTARYAQDYVDICAGGGGIYLAVWQDRRSNTDYDIYGILLDANGVPITSESFLISKMAGGAAAPSDQLYPAVGFNGTYFLVAWADRRAVDLIYRIYATRVTTTGEVLDLDGIAFPTAATRTDQFAPQIASNGTNWEVVWQEKTSTGGDDVYGIAVSGSGTFGSRVAIAYRVDLETWPTIAWNGTQYLVVWQDFRNSESTGTDIYGSRLTSAGAKVANSEIVISTAVGSSTNGAPGAQSVPSVAANGSGTWLVVWQDARGADEDIYCARVNAAGALQDLGGKLVTVTTVANNQEEPSVGWDGTYFLVAWRDKNASYGIRGARINSSGVVQDTSGISITAAAAGQYGPAVAGQSGSSLVGMYTLDMSPDVYGARVTSAGVVGSLTEWSLCIQDQPQFSAAFDGTNYTVVWSDRRSGMYRVYAARISTSGTILDAGGVLVTTTAGGDQTQPAISWNGANYLVVWTEQGAMSTDIKGMRLSPVLARVDASPLNLCVVDLDQHSPAVAWSGTNWLVAWVDYRSAVAPYYYCDIRGARVTAAGVITAVSAIAGADNNQFAPTVASCGGNFLVAWEDYRSGSPAVYCSRVTSTGTIQDPSGVQVTTVIYWSVQPKVVSNGTNYFIVWSDKRDGWSNDNIYGVRISTTATRLDAADLLVCNNNKSQVAPSTFWNGTNYLVAWQDYRNSSATGYDIYLNQVSPAGAVVDPADRLISGGAQSEVNPAVLASGGQGLALYSNYMNATYRTAGRVLSEPPPVPVVTDDGAYSMSPNSLHATWSAAPRQAEVAEYRYAIGTTPGGVNVVGWTSTLLLTEVTRIDLSLTDGVTYYFAVQTRNSSGTWGDPGMSDGIMVDASAPTTPVVTDDGVYVVTNTLHATWSSADPQTGVQEYRYAIGTSSGATNVVGWTSAGTSTGVTRTDLTLTDGATYYFSVQARNASGLWSTAGNSNGIMYDASAPTTPVVTDDGAYTASSESLHATWTSSDPHSGIQEYKYAIGTSIGGNEIVDWTTTGTSVEVTKTGLSLADGTTYYFSVQARNGAGAWSTAGNSDGITVDTTAPTAPVVTDDGAYTTTVTSLHATWTASESQSGIAEYQYTIGTSMGGNNIADWTSTGTTAEVTHTGLSLTDGTTYYFSVKAKNGAGTWGAVGNSDGIMVDTSAPTTPVVTDDGVYTTSLTSLHATWTASDPQSGIQEYQYAIGTSIGGNNIVDWTSTGTTAGVTKTGLSLINGTAYFFSVRARNGAGAWGTAGNSDGITADASVPTTPVVTDDGVYTTTSTSLHATWTASDPQSGIAEYQYAIGTSIGGNNIVDWTSTGTTAGVTKTGLSLTDGTAYYFSVRARNGAGAWGAAGNSDGITADASAPTTPVVTDDGVYTTTSTSLHATWSASDPQSGIAEYQYAIGTSIGGNNIVDWTSTGTTAGVTKTGLSLIDGTAYFFSVKARNGAGTWGAAGNSDGITADATAPTRPVVVDDGNFMNHTTLHATWTSGDPHSGIQEYQYAIGTTLGGNNVLDWTSTGTTAWVSKTGLSLTDGLTYYFMVRAKNGAGAWSLSGNSDGIIVDGSAPSTSVVTDDGVYTSSSNSLHATWTTSSDPHSGIVEYQYAIGTSVGGNNTVDWTTTGMNTVVTKTGLSLIDGTTYYFSVKSRNGADLWSSAGNSDGIIAEASAPTTPIVADDGAYTTSSTSLHATWTASDPQSGIQEYQYAIGTSVGGNNIVDWTSTGTTAGVTKTGLSLVNGTTYYFSVKAKNGAGLWSTAGNSDGITVDTSAPTTPVVTDDGVYTTDAGSLHATWTASDPQSGIQEYQYAIGTSIGGNNIVDWTSTGTTAEVTKTGLSLTDGTTYYFSVKVRNGAGLWSSVGSSDGITMVSGPPTTPVVTDDGDYTLPDMLHATWVVANPHGSIVEYQYAIGTSIGGTTIVGWTSVGTATEVTRTGLSLQEGSTYYINVKARNAAGLWSDVGSSNGIAVPPAFASILGAKSMPNGQTMRLSGKVVTAGTASLPDLPGPPYFYIQESSGMIGIKVISSTTIATGSVVDIAGVIEAPDGERQITASVARVVSPSGTVPGAVNMTDRAIGGAALNVYTPGVYMDSGPHNVGSFIKTWGKITYAGGAGADYFYMNGGCFMRDGSGYVGVKVYCGTLAKPTVGSNVVVTGISSCEWLSSHLVRRVLATEIVEYP